MISRDFGREVRISQEVQQTGLIGDIRRIARGQDHARIGRRQIRRNRVAIAIDS